MYVQYMYAAAMFGFRREHACLERWKVWTECAALLLYERVTRLVKTQTSNSRGGGVEEIPTK